ncbi:MAG: hypothetical protein ACOY0T_12865 [Myxococcota bacterium]
MLKQSSRRLIAIASSALACAVLGQALPSKAATAGQLNFTAISRWAYNGREIWIYADGRLSASFTANRPNNQMVSVSNSRLDCYITTRPNIHNAKGSCKLRDGAYAGTNFQAIAWNGGGAICPVGTSCQGWTSSYTYGVTGDPTQTSARYHANFVFPNGANPKEVAFPELVIRGF